MLILKKIYNIAENLCDRCEIIARFLFRIKKSIATLKKPAIKISKFCVITDSLSVIKTIFQNPYQMVIF